jgi:hypothetical protein
MINFQTKNDLPFIILELKPFLNLALSCFKKNTVMVKTTWAQIAARFINMFSNKRTMYKFAGGNKEFVLLFLFFSLMKPHCIQSKPNITLLR